MSRCELVGVLNITPDSFSDGGQHNDPEKAVFQAEQLFEDGASIVDVGAESTRPGAKPLDALEEWQRLEPILNQLITGYTDAISLDTYHPETVRKAAQMGSFIINDVTSFNNPEMQQTAAEFGFRCIVSHLPNKYGQDIQHAHSQRNVDSVHQVLNELLARREEMKVAGIADESIILDPGIGFGKTAELNFELLEFASLIDTNDVMIGYSRKRFLGEDRMGNMPNLLAGKIAVQAGAKYLRVHDVAAHKILLRR